jgi:hypothetical protein
MIPSTRRRKKIDRPEDVCGEIRDESLRARRRSSQ